MRLSPFKALALQEGRGRDQVAVASKAAGGALALRGSKDPLAGPILLGGLVIDDAGDRFGNVPQPDSPVHFAGRVRVDPSLDPQHVLLRLDQLAAAPSGAAAAAVRVAGPGGYFALPLYAPEGAPPPPPVGPKTRNVDFRWNVAAPPSPNQPPVAGVGVSRTSITSGDSVNISLTSFDPDGTVNSGVLNYGDGTAAETINFPAGSVPRTKTYTTSNPAGQTYTITWRVTDNQGAQSAVATASVFVAPVAPPNQAPAAFLSVNFATVQVNQSATFTLTGSDPDGSIASGVWSPGDGTAPETISLPANPTFRAKSYAVAGSYTATWRVTDNAGAQSPVASVVMTVVAAPPPPPPNQPPTAGVGLSRFTITSGDFVAITLTSSDPDGTVSQGVLSYGDGSAGETINAPAASVPRSHQYFTAGLTQVFTVTWRVTDNLGAQSGVASAQVTVNPLPVNQPPTAAIGASKTQLANDEQVTLTLQSGDADGTVNFGILNYGDGSAPEQINFPTATVTRFKRYQASGSPQSYVATWRTTDNSGAQSALASVTLTVQPPPPPPVNLVPSCTLSASPLSGTSPLAVTFSMTENDPDGTIDFGRLQLDTTNPAADVVIDNPPGSLHTWVNQYLAPGPGNSNYTARYQVTDNLGAVSVAQSVVISVAPQAVLVDPSDNFDAPTYPVNLSTAVSGRKSSSGHNWITAQGDFTCNNSAFQLGTGTGHPTETGLWNFAYLDGQKSDGTIQCFVAGISQASIYHGLGFRWTGATSFGAGQAYALLAFQGQNYLWKEIDLSDPSPPTAAGGIVINRFPRDYDCLRVQLIGGRVIIKIAECAGFVVPPDNQFTTYLDQSFSFTTAFSVRHGLLSFGSPQLAGSEYEQYRFISP